MLVRILVLLVVAVGLTAAVVVASPTLRATVLGTPKAESPPQTEKALYSTKGGTDLTILKETDGEGFNKLDYNIPRPPKHLLDTPEPEKKKKSSKKKKKKKKKKVATKGPWGGTSKKVIKRRSGG